MTTTESGAAALDLTPAPESASAARRIAAQTRFELRAILRNGEQLLLTLVIPIGVLLLFGTTSLIDLDTDDRLGFLTPGVLALAVMSTAFTGQAIGTGFERRYGVLRRLGCTPLSRAGLIVAKTLAVLAVELLQAAVIVGTAVALGWRPDGNPVTVLLLLLLGTAAFSGLGLLMAGTLRAEATLAAANLVYVVLLVAGGVIFPLTKFPAAVAPVLELLPIAALAEGLRAVLQHGTMIPSGPLIVLGCWAVAAPALAALAFKWD